MAPESLLRGRNIEAPSAPWSWAIRLQYHLQEECRIQIDCILVTPSNHPCKATCLRYMKMSIRTT